MGQKFAAYNARGEITGFYDSEDSPLPNGIPAIEITDAQWQTCINAQGSPYTVVNGALVAPVPPTAAQLLAAEQASQIAMLTAAYNEAIQQAVTFTTSGGVTKTFQADVNSQDVLLKATTGYNLSGSTPTGFYWVSSDNTQVPFTLADLKGLYGSLLAQGNAAFQKLQTLKAQVNNSERVADVQGINW